MIIKFFLVLNLRRGQKKLDWFNKKLFVSNFFSTVHSSSSMYSSPQSLLFHYSKQCLKSFSESSIMIYVAFVFTAPTISNISSFSADVILMDRSHMRPGQQVKRMGVLTHGSHIWSKTSLLTAHCEQFVKSKIDFSTNQAFFSLPVHKGFPPLLHNIGYEDLNFDSIMYTFFVVVNSSSASVGA